MIYEQVIPQALLSRYKAKGIDDVGCKAAPLEVTETAERDEGLVVTATATTADIDLSGEVVVPEGALMVKTGQGMEPDYLAKMRAVYLNHDYDELPIGTHRHAVLRDGRWKVQFVLHGRTQASRDAVALMRLGADSPIRGVSIGFQRIEGSARLTEAEMAKYGPASYITRSWRWLEYSLTPNPMNAAATVEMIARRFETGQIAASTAKSLGVCFGIKKKIVIV